MYKRAGIKTERYELYDVKKNGLYVKASSVDRVLF